LRSHFAVVSAKALSAEALHGVANVGVGIVVGQHEFFDK